jgi:hypothetical protein
MGYINKKITQLKVTETLIFLNLAKDGGYKKTGHIQSTAVFIKTINITTVLRNSNTKGSNAYYMA